MRREITLLFIAALVGTPAAAQTQKPPRLVLSVNGIYQGGTSDVTSTVAFTANAETATFSTTSPVPSGPGFDAGVRFTVHGPFALGFAATKFTASGTADVTAKIPHPFFFNQPRTISGTAPVSRDETTMRIELAVQSKPGTKLQFMLFAGPAYFSVKQDLVDSVTYTDAYPYDTATFKSAVTKQATANNWGFAGGVDVSYYFTKSIGIGGAFALAKSTMSTKASDGSAVELTAGGLQAGGGLRFRF